MKTSYRSAVAELVEWCDRNFLAPNVAKTGACRRFPEEEELHNPPREQRRGRIRIVKQYKHLGTVIDDRLEWTVNMEACYKVNQRMYFLRKPKNLKFSENLLYLLYQSVAQSILLYNQVYSNYSNARKADWERLDSMTTAARTITKHDIRSPTAICEETSLYKFMTIPCDSTHPLHTALSVCAHRRD